MVADDLGDFLVVLDLREDSLADRGMLLHLSTLVEREGASFFEEARRQSDLSNVVNEPSEMGELLFSFREAHAHCDVPRVDRNGCRMTRGVLISGIECRN
jgi:hypothetical protein